MKEGWSYKKLDDICTIVGRIGFRGYTKADLVNSSKDGAITLSPSNIIDGELDFSKCTYINWDKYYESPEIMLGNGDIVLVKTASIGKCAVVKNLPHEATLNPQFVVLKQLVGVPEFICYYLKSPIAQNTIKQMAGGVAIPTLSQKKLGMMIVPTPSQNEQQSIVDYLDSAFAKIDTMKANAEKALNEAKALFQASLKEMLEPKEGWEEKALKDFATDMYRGSGVKRDQVTEEGVSCVRYGEIYTQYSYHFNECRSHTLEEFVSSPKYFEYGDILFAITGESVEEIGKSIAYTGKEKCIAGGDIVVMKHNYEPRYVSYALSTPSAIKQKGRGKTKLKVVHTNIPSLKEIIIPIAPKEEQIKIADTLDTLKSKVDRLQENFDKISQECDALKQAILRQVFE